MSSHPTTYFHESMQTAGTCVISWEESHDPYMNLIGMFSEFVFLLAYMQSQSSKARFYHVSLLYLLVTSICYRLHLLCSIEYCAHVHFITCLKNL